MKKTLIKIVFILYIFMSTIKIRAIEINSQNAILYNLKEDKVIFEKNSEEKVKIASLTKIMTTIIALENINDLQDEVIVTQEALNNLEGYVTINLKPGEKITYEDLLYGTMLPSAADCANQIAISISGNVEQFVELMNQKAKELGLENTHFSNPIGMDDDNYSTTKEMAEILKYALKNEEFYKIFTTKEYTTKNNKKLQNTIIEKSQKENVDSSIILGSKTGFTDEAGYCLATISKINNINYLLVTTNAETEKEYHVIDALNIYDYYSKNYSYKKILSYNQILKKIKVEDAITKEYEIKSDNDIYQYINNDIDINNLTYEYEGIEEVTRKTNTNNEIGKIKIKNGEEILYTYNIYLKEIPLYNFKRYLLSLIISVMIIGIIIISIIKQKIKLI